VHVWFNLTNIDGFCKDSPNYLRVKLNKEDKCDGGDEKESAEDEANDAQRHPRNYELTLSLKNDTKINNF
jgi:hypothetical protein